MLKITFVYLLLIILNSILYLLLDLNPIKHSLHSMDCVNCVVFVLPISRGDSFLLLVLCGDAPCCSRTPTLSTKPASAARVRGVSPSPVCSSRVRSADIVAITENTIMILYLSSSNSTTNDYTQLALTLHHNTQYVPLWLHSRCMQRQPPPVALSEGRNTTRHLL